MATQVLIIGQDPTLLRTSTGFGDSFSRHVFYADRLQMRSPNSQIRVVTTSPRNQAIYLQPRPNLRIYGTNSFARILYILDAARAVRRAVADGWRPTVVTTQNPFEDGQLGLFLARRYGAKFIPQLHFDLYSPDWLRESLLNPLRLGIARRILRRADMVRVVSNEQKRKLVTFLGLRPEAISVIPVGVSLTPTDLSRDACKARIAGDFAGHKVVLFVGRLVAQKNIPLWVAVAEEIDAREPGTRFLIAGDGLLSDEMKALVKKAGLAHAFRFLGDVAYTDLPLVYGAADLLLLTSFYEGFGRVVVEAHLAKLPVVATRCTGPEEIVVDGETGHIREIGDVRGLADAAVSLLADDALSEKFGIAGRESAEAMFGRTPLADRWVDMWVSA